MNGVHDMGGMHGFGPVAPERDEPVFHAPWEARALAVTVAAGARGRWTIDMSRHARERLPPSAYLASSYYERWIGGLEMLLVERGLVTSTELATGTPDPNQRTLDPGPNAEAMQAILRRGGPTTRETQTPPGFVIGDRVRAKSLNPPGHTRLPRYVRGKVGTVVLHHGAHVFADTNAHGLGECPQHLYAVRFKSQELWGAEASSKDTVTLDLWESYLEAADG